MSEYIIANRDDLTSVADTLRATGAASGQLSFPNDFIKAINDIPQSGGNVEDGFSPVANVEQTATGAVISITDKSGTTTATITNGKDYVLTEADKSEIAAQVIEMLGGNPIFGYVDSETMTVVLKNAPDGEYSLAYLKDDGSVSAPIGSMVKDTNIYYSVTNNLTNCTNSNDAVEVIGGESYSAIISPNSGYELTSVTVTMGGTDITASAVNGGIISISKVTGAIAITAVATKAQTGPNYTNLLPSAIDTDESAYGDGKGYVSGYKLSCSSEGGTPSELSDAFVSGFIRVTDIYDVIRIKNVTLHANANVNNVIFYRKDKTKIYGVPGVAGGFAELISVDDGVVYRFRPGAWLSAAKAENMGYFRFSCGGITDETIVTVNEEIV